MPKRPTAPRRKRRPAAGKKPVNVLQPQERQSQTAQQQLIAREEDAICKRIVEELGFSPQSLTALREFRQMHSPDVE